MTVGSAMKALVLGGSGLLGKYLMYACPSGVELTSTWYSNPIDDARCCNLDIGNNNQLNYVISRIAPDVIINAAAIGSVDYCQRNWSHAQSVNVQAVGALMSAARECGVKKVVHISTNAVFDGKNPPYSEDDDRNPSNLYGSMKKSAEDVVMDFPTSMWLIVRPILLFGWPRLGGRDNWAVRVIENLRLGKPLKIVNDTVTQPTHAMYCANVIWQLIHKDLTGVYHVGGNNKLSLYEFAIAVATVFDIMDIGLLEPVSSDYFQDIAPRPRDTTYTVGKLVGAGISRAQSLWDELGTLRNEEQIEANHAAAKNI